MIIYQAVPSRLYPVIIDSILKDIYLESERFWSLFELKNDENTFKKSNILDENFGPFGFFLPKNFIYLCNKSFVYGAFSLKHFNLKKEDFTFSIMSHPVDHIYELYARRESLIKYYSQEIQNYQDNQSISIEKFIDDFLEKKEVTFNFKENKCKMIDEAVFQYKEKSLNYIGKISNLKKVSEVLTEVFDTRINLTIKNIKYNSYSGIYYRKKDVEILLKDQLNFYNSLE